MPEEEQVEPNEPVVLPIFVEESEGDGPRTFSDPMLTHPGLNNLSEPEE